MIEASQGREGGGGLSQGQGDGGYLAIRRGRARKGNAAGRLPGGANPL